MMEKKIPLVYICIHKRLCDKFKDKDVINRKEIFNVFGKIYHVPKTFRYIVLKEMVELSMVEKISRDSFKLLASNLDLENTSKIFKDFKLY